MKIVYSYVGKLPHYIIYTIHQSRIFSNDDIYLITDDYTSELLTFIIKEYNVIIIPYSDVKSDMFDNVMKDHIETYSIVKELIPYGREKLFILSLERFFLLYNLMISKNLNNVLFLEIDNVIYDNPDKWFVGVADPRGY